MSKFSGFPESPCSHAPTSLASPDAPAGSNLWTWLSFTALFFCGGGGGFCFLLSVCCLSLHCLWYWIFCCPKGCQGTRPIGLLSPGMPSMVPRTSVFVRMNGPDSKHLLRGAERERSHQAGVKQRRLPLVMRPSGGLKVHETPLFQPPSASHLALTWW